MTGRGLWPAERIVTYPPNPTKAAEAAETENQQCLHA
jgi:hypothetical protein